MHLCHFLFLQQLPSSLLDPGRSRKAEKSPRFQVSGSEKLQIRCEKQSESESRSWFLFTQIFSVIWSPRSGSSLGTGKHGGESQSKSALPEQPCKRDCSVSPLSSQTELAACIYAQQQQSWLIAHLSTVHASSCNAMESRQPRPLDGLCCSRAAGIQGCSVPPQQEQIPGTH